MPEEKLRTTESESSFRKAPQSRSNRYDAEEVSRANEERFRELFENANDAIFLYDLKGRIIEFNRAAEQLTGYEREKVLGEPPDNLLIEEARHLIRDSVGAHLGGSAPQHYEMPILAKDGSHRFLEVGTRMIYRRGQPVAIQGIGRDVTERKQAQHELLETSRELQLKNQELRGALDMAEQATRLKQQFLANTSHELRTPLNGIMGMIDLLQSTALSAEQSEYAEAIDQCADDLLTIINDLLDLSQMEAQRLSIEAEFFDLRESVRSVVKLLSTRAAEKDLNVSYQVDELLPQFVWADSVRFRQVLTNLLANAIKFTPAGSVTVRLSGLTESNRMRCEVMDTGIGVEDSVRDRIFEAFFQADGRTQRRFGGTGLGLAICRQLISMMGGSIGVQSRTDGPGTTFWFELPLRDGEQTLATVGGTELSSLESVS